MSAWGWLTGKNAGKIIDGAKQGLDKAWYTEEEKADADKGFLEFTLAYMKATLPQALTRRIIAVVVVGVWAVLVLTIVVSGYFSRTEGSFAMFTFNVLKELVMNPFNIVLGFYFLTQTIRAAMSKGQK